MPRGKTRATALGRVTAAVMAAASLALGGAQIARAGSHLTPPTPSLARSYFSDLSARRYVAATLLEAPCNQTITEHASGSAVASLTLLRGRGPEPDAARSLHFVGAVHISRIRPYSTPLLARYHIAGFDVSGWYRFVYAGGARGAVANRHPSGFYHVHLIARRCAGMWRIDPGWVQGSPADFAGGICVRDCNIICDASGCRRVW